MASNRNLLVLPGDGIGPEVMNEVRKIIAWMGTKRAVGFDIKEDVVGGAALDKHGVPLSDDAMKTALEADAVLFGSVGGPKWDNVEFNKKPERGLLRLRKEMDLFANLRPAKVFDALIDASSLKPEIVKGLDIMIIRELTGGVYFGEPRGVTTLANGEREASTPSATRPAKSAASAPSPSSWPASARTRSSSEKANVMHTGVLWREEATKLHKESYSDVALSHMYADRARHAAAALAQAVRRHRHRQPVRRHAVGRGRDADRLARHAALGLARRARRHRPAQGALRADPRQRARHRRQGPGQSDGRDAQLRHDAALLLRPRQRSRPGRTRGRERAGGGLPHRRPLLVGKTDGIKKVGTQEMGDAIVKELDRLA